MGWDFFCDRSIGKKQVIERVLSPTHWGPNFTILKHSLVGSNLWMGVERRCEDGTTVKFIALYLLRGGGKDSGWGYKALEESMGPCEVNCPLYLLDLIPDPCNSYSTKWRESVREYHANKRNRAKNPWEAGQRILLGDKGYTLLEPRTTWRGRKAGWYVRSDDGIKYRVSAQQMGRASLAPEVSNAA